MSNNRRIRNALQEMTVEYPEILNLDFMSFIEEMQHYRAAISEIKTKLEILDEEFEVRFQYNPIHHIDSRLKAPKSIFMKLIKLGLPITGQSMRESVMDIAGIRVVCNYIDDIYSLADLLLKQDDIRLIEKKDYIENPKPSGYRSLHIVIEVPIFLSSEKILMPVEVQIRTIAMDAWASLEHQLRYKNGVSIDEKIRTRLENCASEMTRIDLEMQSIQKEITQLENEEREDEGDYH